MNYQLKKIIQETVDLIAMMAEKYSKKTTNQRLSKDDYIDLFKHDMAAYMMYLSASDGKVTYSEVRTINSYLDSNYTLTEIEKIIKEYNIYSTEFEQTVPVSLKLVIPLTTLFYLENPEMTGQPHPGEIMIYCYKAVGEELISSDLEISDSEETDYNIYVSMIEEYINNEIVKNDNRLSSVFSSDSGNVKAPSKSGVEAPKKA